MKIGSWQIAVVQDCNLRCTYCVTRCGRTGGPPRAMARSVRDALLESILDGAAEDGHVALEFGTGETFLAWNDFIEWIDRARVEGEARGIRIDVQVGTNGTLLDEARLKALADRHVSVTFSLDGPAAVHDARRRDATGAGTFAKGFENWQRYRAMSLDHQLKPACNVQSVYTGDVPLSDIGAFWREQGSPLFSCVVQAPPPSAGPAEWAAYEDRWDKYLGELETWLAEQSMTGLPHFLSQYCGPTEAYQYWRARFTDRPAGPCGAGVGMLAVDADGDIYPCELFFGQPDRRLGDVFHGMLPARRDAFLADRNVAYERCALCEVAADCGRGCLGIRRASSLPDVMDAECERARRYTAVLRRSYALLSGTEVLS